MTDELRERVARAIYEAGCQSAPGALPWAQIKNLGNYTTALAQADAALAVMPGWEPISEKHKDGELYDLWCVPFDEECEVKGVRLTDCSWHVADDIMDYTGWVRTVDNGDWDPVEGPPCNELGLPPWKPIACRPLPAPPIDEPGGENG